MAVSQRCPRDLIQVSTTNERFMSIHRTVVVTSSRFNSIWNVDSSIAEPEKNSLSRLIVKDVYLRSVFSLYSVMLCSFKAQHSKWCDNLFQTQSYALYFGLPYVCLFLFFLSIYASPLWLYVLIYFSRCDFGRPARSYSKRDCFISSN